MKKIAVFGDSILKGAVTGYSDHLFDILPENSLTLAQKKLGFEMFNDSVFGSTISKTQKRLNKFFEKGENADIVIIESGGNDCDFDWNTWLRSEEPVPPQRTLLPDFIRILDEMVLSVKNKGVLPVVMTMPSLVADRWYNHITRTLDEETRKKVDNFLGENPIDTLSKNHELYNLNLMEYCRKNKVTMIDMRKAILESGDYRSIMCKDGIHPNEKGYEYMAGVWEKFLPEIL